MAIGILASSAVLAAAILGIGSALGPAHRPGALSPDRAHAGRPLPDPGRSTAVAQFAWLTSTTPPARWARLTLSSGLGSLSIPPRFGAVRGDRGTYSFALVRSDGSYLGYLNVTPLQGDERLQGWAAFRLAHLHGDGTASAREDAAVQAVRTRDALRSCVTDDYVTDLGHHHFHEVACLVVTGSSGSVVVAATPSGDPGRVWTQLERAVAAYPFP